MKTNEFVLPEKWAIVGCQELKDYFKEIKIGHILDGNYDNQIYFISDSDGKWDCDLIEYKNPKTHIITFDQFKEHVLGEDIEHGNKEVFETKCGQKFKLKSIPVSELKEIKPKKLIGYKLVKEEYKEAVKQILKCNPTQDSDFLIGLLIHLNSDFHRKLKDAEVLDLWFDPVYEELSIEEKISDYLAGEGIGLTYEQVKNVIDIINESKAPKM